MWSDGTSCTVGGATQKQSHSEVAVLLFAVLAVLL